MRLIADITNREKFSGCKALWDYMGGGEGGVAMECLQL